VESVWSEDLEDKLIDLWQQYECLYQITAGSYRDRQKSGMLFTSRNPSAVVVS